MYFTPFIFINNLIYKSKGSLNMKKWRTVKYVLVLLTQPLTHSLYLYAWLDSFWWRKKLTLIPSPNKTYMRFLSSGIFYSSPKRKLLLYISKWGGGLDNSKIGIPQNNSVQVYHFLHFEMILFLNKKCCEI